MASDNTESVSEESEEPAPEDENMGWVHDTDSGYRDPMWPDGKIPDGESGWVDDTKLNRVALKLYRSDELLNVERVRGKGVLLKLGDAEPSLITEDQARELSERIQDELA